MLSSKASVISCPSETDKVDNGSFPTAEVCGGLNTTTGSDSEMKLTVGVKAKSHLLVDGRSAETPALGLEMVLIIFDDITGTDRTFDSVFAHCLTFLGLLLNTRLEMEPGRVFVLEPGVIPEPMSAGDVHAKLAELDDEGNVGVGELGL